MKVVISIIKGGARSAVALTNEEDIVALHRALCDTDNETVRQVYNAVADLLGDDVPITGIPSPETAAAGYGDKSSPIPDTEPSGAECVHDYDVRTDECILCGVRRSDVEAEAEAAPADTQAPPDSAESPDFNAGFPGGSGFPSSKS